MTVLGCSDLGFLNPSGFSFTLLTITHFPPCLPDLLLCRQHIRHSRSQGEWHPVRHRGNRCSQCLHDHSCCRYPVWVLLTELWGKELSAGFDDISGRRLLRTVCFSPGVHCGGHRPTAAPPLWLWDLLWGLCAAHSRSQLPGTWESASLSHHILSVLLCCPLLGQHAVWFFGCILCILFPLLGKNETFLFSSNLIDTSSSLFFFFSTDDLKGSALTLNVECYGKIHFANVFLRIIAFTFVWYTFLSLPAKTHSSAKSHMADQLTFHSLTSQTPAGRRAVSLSLTLDRWLNRIITRLQDYK